MKNNKIACVVLNYNDFETTVNFLSKISKYSILDEIIVVDNCSTNLSYEILKKQENDKIHVVEAGKNGGYGAGNNFGINQAYNVYDCKYAVVANPDVLFEEKLVRELMVAFSEDISCAVVSAKQINPRKKREIKSFWNLPSYLKYTLSALYLISKLLENNQNNKKKFIGKIKTDCVAGCFLIVDIEKFLLVGGYDEDIFLYCEETTLGYKLLSEGFSTYSYIDKSYIHMHAESTKKSIPSAVARRKLLLSSRFIFMKKYMHINLLQQLFTKFIFKIAIIEEVMKSIIRKFFDLN